MNKVDITGNDSQEISKRMTICPNCGKQFYLPISDRSIYKFVNISGKRRTFCGWNCYNEGKAINDSKKKRSGWF